MNKTFIGIDNGVSGSVGYILSDGRYNFKKTPINMTFSHTADGQKMNRINHEKLKNMFLSIKSKSENIMCYIERPFTQRTKGKDGKMVRFYKAIISAARAMESTIVVLEQLQIPYQSIGSRKWQQEILPGVKGSSNLKAASLETGKRLFPGIEKIKHSDYDGILIAEWARRNNL